ncbi:site-specific integrase [Peptostreptococcus equinus]|uniref:Site-specific integrase n=1 Tax=Peptostreptococcus equinus TaxID=3003601 RepID=A0ABY7JR52_9FIRM|nr:site-specific integrase [Peptostreptococcus sp. CBA3647]WAW14648.1 site-specific integrase [Peptostreptococcus sp. CBA3647]
MNKDYHEQEIWTHIQKDGSVKYELQYTAPNGKKRRKTRKYAKDTAKNRNQAKKDIMQAIDEEFEQAKLDDCITLGKLIDMWFKTKQYTRQTTYKTVNSQFNSLKNLLGENLIIDTLSLKQMNLLFLNATKSNRKFIKMLLNFGFSEGILTNYELNNFKNIKNSAVHDNVVEKEYYEKEELKVIFKNLKEKDTYTSVMTSYILEFQTLTGNRIGEILALKDSEVKNNTININATYSNGFLVNATKTATSNRILGLNKRCKEIILEAKKLKFENGIRSDIVFCSRKGLYLDITSIRQCLKSIGANQKTHKFRKTHASLLAEAGVPLQVITRRLGHKDSKITERIYIQVTRKMKENDIELFSNLEIL